MITRLGELVGVDLLHTIKVTNGSQVLAKTGSDAPFNVYGVYSGSVCYSQLFIMDLSASQS
jgi:hypothetical protein